MAENMQWYDMHRSNKADVKIHFLDEPDFPDLASTRSVVRRGEVDNRDLERNYQEWKGVNESSKVALYEFKSILQFASKKYEKALCKTVVPRILDTDHFHEDMDWSGLSGADGIVTILYKYDPSMLRKFLDLKNIHSFLYVRSSKDMKHYGLLPFEISRGRDRVKFGYRTGFEHGRVSSRWDTVWDFDILENGEWSIGSAGGLYNTWGYDWKSQGKLSARPETIRAGSARFVGNAMGEHLWGTCEGRYNIHVSWEAR